MSSSWSNKTPEDFINFNLPTASEEYFNKGRAISERFSTIDISASDSCIASNTLSDNLSIDQINKEMFRGFVEGKSKIFLHRMDQTQNKFSSYEIYKLDGKLHYEKLTK